MYIYIYICMLLHIQCISYHLDISLRCAYICSEGMLTHLFFPVRKFGLGSGQIQMFVV